MKVTDQLVDLFEQWGRKYTDQLGEDGEEGENKEIEKQSMKGDEGGNRTNTTGRWKKEPNDAKTEE